MVGENPNEPAEEIPPVELPEQPNAEAIRQELGTTLTGGRLEHRIMIWGNIIALAALAVSIYFNVATNSQSADQQRLLLNEFNQELVREWQQTIVHDIINRSQVGIPFHQIKTEYVAEVTALKDLSVSKSEIQDVSLKRILLDIQRSMLVTQLADGRYITYGPVRNLVSASRNR